MAYIITMSYSLIIRSGLDDFEGLASLEECTAKADEVQAMANRWDEAEMPVMFEGVKMYEPIAPGW